MFGYIRIYKPQLKIIEFERYQGVYCALCKQLGKSYGRFTRISLSYDFTFMALLSMALDDENATFEKGRCVVNPLVKRCFSKLNHSIEFTADVAVLLLYYKLEDNIKDNGFFKSIPARIGKAYLKSKKRKAALKLPEMDAHIKECLESQNEVEIAGVRSIDMAAEPSGQMLAGIAQAMSSDVTERRILHRLGYCLGRWIYLIDAVDDVENDLINGEYNPYICAHNLSCEDTSEKIIEVKQYALLTLNASLVESHNAFQLLDIKRFDGILENIYQLGMPSSQKSVVSKNEDKKNKQIV